MELALRNASFSVHLRGHVGPRKAIFDSIRCGSIPVIASDKTPLALSDSPHAPGGIDYSRFVLRVPEHVGHCSTCANVSLLLRALEARPRARVAAMRAAMRDAAATLDYSGAGGLFEAALERVERVAKGEVRSVPERTATPIPLSNLQRTGGVFSRRVVRGE